MDGACGGSGVQERRRTEIDRVKFLIEVGMCFLFGDQVRIGLIMIRM